MDDKTNPTRRRFWPRFTLRVLLVFVTAVGVGLGYWTHRAREQAHVVKKMKEMGVDFDYDYELKEGIRRSPVPRWLLSNFGKDFFHRIEATRFGQFDSDKAASREILRDLSTLGGLKRISIESKSITDDEAAVLEAHAQLEALTILCHEHHGMGLTIHTPPLTDRTLEMIGRLPRIKSVKVEGLHFTAAGIQAISESRTLQVLCVHHCERDVTREDLQPLRHSNRLKYVRVTRYRYGDIGWDQIADWGEPPW